MSRNTRLLVTALLATSLLPACIEPAKQGSADSTSGTTDEPATTSTTEPVTPTGTVTTAEPTTSTDPVGPGCEDGQQNGEETDVDCGGGECGPCGEGAACSDDSDCASNSCDDTGHCFPLRRSCLELHMARPDLPSGFYPLDPAGTGTSANLFRCDMDADSPGWTEIFSPEHDLDYWQPYKEGGCGELGELIGPFGTGEVLTLHPNTLSIPHEELRLVGEAVVIDSWDAFEGDQLMIELGDSEIFAKVCAFDLPAACNQEKHHCGSDLFSDGLLPFSVDVPHKGVDIYLNFSSTLTEPADNEAWGVRNVSVFVK